MLLLINDNNIIYNDPQDKHLGISVKLANFSVSVTVTVSVSVVQVILRWHFRICRSDGTLDMWDGDRVTNYFVPTELPGSKYLTG